MGIHLAKTRHEERKLAAVLLVPDLVVFLRAAQNRKRFRIQVSATTHRARSLNIDKTNVCLAFRYRRQLDVHRTSSCDLERALGFHGSTTDPFRGRPTAIGAHKLKHCFPRLFGSLHVCVNIHQLFQLQAN